MLSIQPASILVDTFDMESAQSSVPARQSWKYLSPLDERRSTPREIVVAKGLISEKVSRFGGETEGQIVEVFDLTLHGLGYHAPVSYEIGAMHNVIIMSGPLRLTSRFKVCSCRPTERIGEFDIGGQFC